MFTFGVDSFIWSEIFEKKDIWIIAKAKELGFAVLDFAIAYPDRFPLQEVKAEIDRVGIVPVTTTTLMPDGNVISPDPAVRANGVRLLKQHVDICNTLGTKIFGGVNYAAWRYFSGKPRTEQEWEWSVTALREVARYARETGEVTICFEAINRFETHFLNTAEDTVRYCKEIGTGNVKVHLDTFHMNIEETDFVAATKACGSEYLGYVHTCENNRGIPGTGHVPWADFFRALHAVEYDGPLVIESFDPSFEEFNAGCAIWRHFAATGEELAVAGVKNLRAIERAL